MKGLYVVSNNVRNGRKDRGFRKDRFLRCAEGLASRKVVAVARRMELRHPVRPIMI